MIDKKPLPDVRIVIRGLQLMALEQPPHGRPVTARHRYYSFQAIKQDYPAEQSEPADLYMKPAPFPAGYLKAIRTTNKSKDTIPIAKYF